MLTRVSFRFSAGGLFAACFAGEGEDRIGLEAWSFEGPSPRWQPLRLARPPTLDDQPFPLDDGRILLCRNGAESHELSLIDPRDGTGRERVLAVVDGCGFRLLPGAGNDALAVAFDGARSTIHRVSVDAAPHLAWLVELPGLLEGGVWLDSPATHLGVDLVDDGGPAKAVAVDLRDGSVTSLLKVTETSNDRLLACDPRSGLLVVSTDALGAQRLGWGRLGARSPVRFPQRLHGSAQPLTLDPEGQRVLLESDEGARSRLAVYTPAEDRLAPVEMPPGRVRGAAYWGSGFLRFPFSSPSQPTGIATIGLGAAPGCSLAGHAPQATSWTDAHIEWLEGAAGHVEAIVYGGEGWGANRHLLLALHGGPVDAWRFEFEPFFQLLAAAGIAVVAPNQRGSSGYGTAHTLAIRGAWGGPDLDDVLCIARGIAAQRCALGAGQLMLCGSSYGAFLALLAASREPHLWSHCVALAPFLSGLRLYREATPAVRELLERLGGLRELDDELGPRDVLRLCHAVRAKLLIAHGDRDEVVPVSQSRALRQRLLALGRQEHVDFTYVEVPGGHHGLRTDTAHALHELLVHFLLGATPDGATPSVPISNK
ncbi:MAG: alpha/beta hydrolase family protein [Egibacteraceae bacterium]